MRYERKYKIEDSSYDGILHEVLCNPASFVSAYPNRQVNSIYYDDINYTAYNDNLLGASDRVKYRMRWYGDNLSAIRNPILEKKIKKNQLGSKQLTSMKDFCLVSGAPALDLPLTNQLTPYVLVRYERTYLVSMDGLIRATLDQDLEFVNIINGKPVPFSKKEDCIILEIKYDKGQEDLARQCTNAIPYRMTKNSKYVSAMGYYLH